MANKDRKLSDCILYTTVRIETFQDGRFNGSGSGFFYQFLAGMQQDSTLFRPSIITNKHVIAGSNKIKITLVESDENYRPLDGRHITYEILLTEDVVVLFDNSEVDLCAIFINPAIVKECEVSKRKPYIEYFGRDHIRPHDELSALSSLEEIVMIGYPNGLWDAVNNKPIFRRGVTATHVKFDYNGKKEFLIDAACFPGSSGSPVVIFNEGSFTKDSKLYLGDRFMLLGILFSGPQNMITGEIRIINSPLLNKQVSISAIPNNLGFVIKSDRILELEEWYCQKYIWKSQIAEADHEVSLPEEGSPE